MGGVAWQVFKSRYNCIVVMIKFSTNLGKPIGLISSESFIPVKKREKKEKKEGEKKKVDVQVRRGNNRQKMADISKIRSCNNFLGSELGSRWGLEKRPNLESCQ